MGRVLKLRMDDLIDEERIILSDRYLPIMAEKGVGMDSTLQMITNDIITYSTNLGLAIKRDSSSDFTAIKKSADQRRDKGIDLVEESISYNIKRSDPTLSAAAHVLKKCYDKAFSGVNIRNNMAETASINIFLKEIEAPEAVAAIDTLGINSEVTDIREGQQDYINAEQERTSTRESDTTPLLHPTRTMLHKTFAFLDRYLEHRLDRGDTSYSDLAESLHLCGGEVMAIAKARETRKENSAE